MHVHALQVAEATLESIRARLGPRVEITGGETIGSPGTVEVLVAGRIRREHVEACPRLRAVIVPWAGLPRNVAELLRGFPQIAVHAIHHNAAATAEMAVGLLLAAASGLVPADGRLRRHDWSDRHDPSNRVPLEGKTALVLGYGAVGRRVARVLRALGMHVLAVRRGGGAPAPAEGDAAHEVRPVSDLAALLPRAHAVVVALPLTHETRGLLGVRELGLLPPGAVLVNVGRGAVVEEEALYEALRSRRLHGAGIDVWYRYPEDEAGRGPAAPATRPFWELENVVLSPHRGGMGGAAEMEERRAAALVELLDAAARGAPIPGRIDLERGY